MYQHCCKQGKKMEAMASKCLGNDHQGWYYNDAHEGYLTLNSTLEA